MISILSSMLPWWCVYYHDHIAIMTSIYTTVMIYQYHHVCYYVDIHIIIMTLPRWHLSIVQQWYRYYQLCYQADIWMIPMTSKLPQRYSAVLGRAFLTLLLLDFEEACTHQGMSQWRCGSLWIYARFLERIHMYTPESNRLKHATHQQKKNLHVHIHINTPSHTHTYT